MSVFFFSFYTILLYFKTFIRCTKLIVMCKIVNVMESDEQWMSHLEKIVTCNGTTLHPCCVGEV